MELNHDRYTFPLYNPPSNQPLLQPPSTQTQMPAESSMEDEKHTQKCPRCLKTFPTAQQLLQHSLVHNNVRKYPCQFCDKSFKQLSHVQQHLRIHTGERPYKCVIDNCSKAFRQLSSLQQHLKGHNLSKSFSDSHSNARFSKNGLMLPRPNDLTCQICEKICPNEQRFFQHMHKYHPDFWRVFSGGVPLSEFFGSNPSSSKDSPFLCSICNKRYIHRTGYIKHMSTHAEKNRATSIGGETGEVSCNVCKKVFSKESYLQRHLEMKTDSEHAESLNEFKKNSFQKQLHKPVWYNSPHPFHVMCLPSSESYSHTPSNNSAASFSHLIDKNYYPKQNTHSYFPPILQNTISNTLTSLNINHDGLICPPFTSPTFSSSSTDFTNPYKGMHNYYQDSFLNIRPEPPSSSSINRIPTYFDHHNYFPPKPVYPHFPEDPSQTSTNLPILPNNSFLDPYPSKSPQLSTALQHLSRFSSFR